MDQPGRGIGSAAAAEAHDKNQYQSNPVMSPATNPPILTVGPSVPSYYPREHDYALQCMHRYQQQQEQLQEKVKSFWAQQLKDIEENADLRNHSVPLSRIKKIMKTDADVKLVSAETPVLFAKAIELFIMELTMKAWANAEDNNRRTLQKMDVASAIARTDVFDFLEDIAPVPRDDTNTMMHQLLAGTAPTPAENAPSSYMPPPQHVPRDDTNTMMHQLLAGTAPTPAENVPYSYMPPPQHAAISPPPFVDPTTLHQTPHPLQTYSLFPISTVHPDEQNTSPISDD